MYSSELVKGTLKTIVLNLLKDQDKMYGYEISQKVKELTSNKILITEGALYPTLHALEKHGDVVVEKVYIGKRVRKYYSLTDQGKQTVSERLDELSDFLNTLKSLLDLDNSLGHA